MLWLMHQTNRIIHNRPSANSMSAYSIPLKSDAGITQSYIYSPGFQITHSFQQTAVT